jgi:hypothetical protein
MSLVPIPCVVMPQNPPVMQSPCPKKEYANYAIPRRNKSAPCSSSRFVKSGLSPYPSGVLVVFCWLWVLVVGISYPINVIPREV